MVKAAESRCLVPVAQRIMRTLARAHNVVDEHIVQMLDAVNTYYEVLNMWHGPVLRSTTIKLLKNLLKFLKNSLKFLNY